MFKLQFSKPRFHVYNEGKSTSCVYECTIIDKAAPRIYKVFKVTGKATCSENDTPNPAIGRMVADSKAKYKAYQTACRMYTPRTIKSAKKEIDKLKDGINFYEQIKYLKKNEEKHIKDLCNV